MQVPKIRSTTVLCVRRDGKVTMAGDGQVTMGSEIVKHTARKIRRLYNNKILAGFAGSTADALSLFARFEDKLQEHQGKLSRAAVELARDWRTDKSLRHLEAVLLVADETDTLLVSGNGDVIEPDEPLAAVGLGRAVRGGGRHGAAQKHQSLVAADRRRGHGGGRQDLHLHQRHDSLRRVGLSPDGYLSSRPVRRSTSLRSTS